MSAALLGNMQQAVATQQIENNVTFRRAEFPGFLHFYPAGLFAFQQVLYFFLQRIKWNARRDQFNGNPQDR
ncbi:hypothetical protein D3C87_2038020 [compost metagenome]